MNETLNYKDLSPITNGLFCEKIFGPTKDFECHCKKYKKMQKVSKPIICPKCNIEITESNIRRYRLG